MLINNMLDQVEYQVLKEKYMRYHRRVGAKNALDAFDLPEEYMPADECKYTHEKITTDEEILFYSWPERYLGRQEEIIGAILKNSMRATALKETHDGVKHSRL